MSINRRSYVKLCAYETNEINIMNESHTDDIIYRYREEGIEGEKSERKM